MFTLTNLSGNKVKDLTIDITDAILEKDKLNFILEPTFDQLLKGKDYNSRKQVAETLDRYILHTLEELYEFKVEYLESSNTNNKALVNEELVDVISYLVTIESLLQQSKHNENIIEISYDPTNVINVFTLLEFSFQNVMLFRRFFPLRKWQYKNKYSKMSEDELDKLYQAEGNNGNLDILSQPIKFALYYAILTFIVINAKSNNLDKIFELLNEIFTMKSNKIYNKIYDLYK